MWRTTPVQAIEKIVQQNTSRNRSSILLMMVSILREEG